MVGIVPIGILKHNRTMPFLKLREPHGASNHKPIWYFIMAPKVHNLTWSKVQYKCAPHARSDIAINTGKWFRSWQNLPFEKYM